VRVDVGGWLLELRHALRRFAANPAVSVAAVLTLALGVGVNTAVFSVVNGVLLRPLPFPEPERLAFITREGDVSIPDGVDWRAQSTAFEEIALFQRSWAFDLSGAGEPERLNGAVVEPDYFRVLRAAPRLGRVISDEDNRLGGPLVVVLSHGFWQRRFGGDQAVVGRSIVLSDVPATVVGVMHQDFDFLGDGVDLWAPVGPATPWALAERGTNNFDAMGRLRTSVSFEQARTDMLAISQRLAAQYPDTNRRKIVEPLPMLDFMVAGARRSLLVLLGAVGLLMLAGSVNLAGLLLARSSARQDEFAVRVAIGAGRWRILRQLLAEGLMLALVGGALGLLAAAWGRELLLALAPDTLPRAREVVLDARVLSFGLAVSLGAGLVVSLIPAFQVLRSDPAAYLKHSGRATPSAARHRALGALVVCELALAFVLLVGAGLLGRTFVHLQRVDLGFDPGNLLSAELVLPESRYAKAEAQTQAFREVVDRANAIPGVVSAAYVITPPLEPRGGIGSPILFATPPDRLPVEAPGARVRLVHGEFFSTLRLPLREGRILAPSDDEGALVAVVNERFARDFWPGRSPLGERISFRWTESPRWMTIVGVVADIKSTTVDAADVRAVYVPYVQRGTDWQRWGTLVLRTRSAPETFVRPLKDAVSAVDPTLALAEVRTIEERRWAQTAQQRFTAAAIAVFAAAALLVALQGVYALLAFVVEERRREIGIRMALGARARDLIGLVARRGLALTALGLAIGGALGLALGRFVEALLYEVEPGDPATFVAVAALLTAAALVACGLPAQRARRVDPMTALRGD
jgi:putative ABC transport system permease protein